MSRCSFRKARRAGLAWVAMVGAGLGPILAPGPLAAADDAAPADSAAAAADSTAAPAAPADSTAVLRKIISTDGAISVFEEARPGEGIEGFWWEYDPVADLQRLLDDDLREQPLEPLVDAYGFNVVLPESILALRDSVTVVADSIRAERIEIDTRFDPRLVSRYNERKDQFTLKHKVDGSVPLGRRGTVSTTVEDQNEFNESTRKVKDDRTLSSAFNYRFGEDLSTSLTVNRSDRTQKRETTLESESEATGVTSRVRAQRTVPLVGQLDTSVGLSFNQNVYRTQRTDGESRQVSPSWTVKTTSDLGVNRLTLDYSGDLARGDRKETISVTTPSDTGLVTSEEFDEAHDKNLKNKVSAGLESRLDENTTFRLSGLVDLDRQQFLSKVDSLAGQQETRTQASRNLQGQLTAKPLENLEFDAKGRLGLSRREFELNDIQYSQTMSRSADIRIDYDPLEKSGFTLKLERKQQEEVLKLRTITSPVTGVVVERYLSPGDRVGQDKILKLAQIDPCGLFFWGGRVAGGSPSPPHSAFRVRVDRAFAAAVDAKTAAR